MQRFVLFASYGYVCTNYSSGTNLRIVAQYYNGTAVLLKCLYILWLLIHYAGSLEGDSAFFVTAWRKTSWRKNPAYELTWAVGGSLPCTDELRDEDLSFGKQ